jgi:hypothetical protein
MEEAVMQLQLELQVVQSRLRYDIATISGQVFESYEDTLNWVVANSGLQYIMDMPALYSLVRPNGQGYIMLLEEESNSNKAGYSSSTQARLAMSFETKVPGIFGGEKLSKNGHPFAVIDGYDKWVSISLKRDSEIKWRTP